MDRLDENKRIGDKMNKIKLTNEKIETILTGLKKLKESKVEINGMAMYYIVKNIKTLEFAYSAFGEVKKGLFQKYGKEDKGSIEIQKENVEEFLKEFSPIASLEVEVEINTIKIDVISEVKLNMDDMISLEFMIEE